MFSHGVGPSSKPKNWGLDILWYVWVGYSNGSASGVSLVGLWPASWGRFREVGGVCEFPARALYLPACQLHSIPGVDDAILLVATVTAGPITPTNLAAPTRRESLRDCGPRQVGFRSCRSGEGSGFAMYARCMLAASAASDVGKVCWEGACVTAWACLCWCCPNAPLVSGHHVCRRNSRVHPFRPFVTLHLATLPFSSARRACPGHVRT